MNRVTATILSLALAVSAGWAADPPAAEEKPKTPAEVLYEKLLADNTKQADAAYVAYQKALDAANQKILVGLEAAKKDLNNPKKGNLSITERAAAIAEIDKKIEEVKKGAVGEAVVAARSVDLLDGGTNMANAIVGKWSINSQKHNGTSIVVNTDKSAQWGDSMIGTWENGDSDNIIIKWSNGISYDITFDKKKVSFKEINKNGVILSMGSLEHGNK
jgi:hypothetical protein